MANADQAVAQPQITAHYIAKSGIRILSRTLARLLAPHNITVNVVSPGFVSSGSAPEEELQKMVKTSRPATSARWATRSARCAFCSPMKRGT